MKSKQTRHPKKNIFLNDKIKHKHVIPCKKIMQKLQVNSLTQCKMKFQYLITYNMKLQNTSFFRQTQSLPKCQTAESLYLTLNPYLMCGSSITSIKPLLAFTRTDPEYPEKDYLNAVTANLILNISPEQINTPLRQIWLQRRTA